MQHNNRDLSSLASLGQFSSVSNVLAALQQQQQRQLAERILQGNSLLNAVGNGRNTDLASILAASRNAELCDTDSMGQGRSMGLANLAAACDLAAARTFGGGALDLTAISSNPLLLASAVAAQRQNELSNMARRDALMNEAYKRGREEALLSLVRYGGIQGRANPGVMPQPSEALSSLSASHKHSAVAQEDSLDALSVTPADRRKQQNNPYFDASKLKDPDPVILANRRARGGVTEPFPEKLHRMLVEVEASGETDIVGFFPHGRAFAVHNPTRFVSEVMPKYFRQSRLSSFQRQLNLYGFTRITQGPDCGGYYHELFLKGRPNLCVHMRRVGVPQASTKDSSKPSSNEPDFYSMTPIANKADDSP